MRTTKLHAVPCRWLLSITSLSLVLATSLSASATEVTFLVTSESHYDALENEDRNQRNRITIDQMNGISTVRWPQELGGDLIEKPRGVLLLGLFDSKRLIYCSTGLRPFLFYQSSACAFICRLTVVSRSACASISCRVPSGQRTCSRSRPVWAPSPKCRVKSF
jgi:hypothetical protein